MADEDPNPLGQPKRSERSGIFIRLTIALILSLIPALLVGLLGVSLPYGRGKADAGHESVAERALKADTPTALKLRFWIGAAVGEGVSVWWMMRVGKGKT